MKNIYYLYIGLILIFIAVLLSCTKYRDTPIETGTTAQGDLSIDEAKAFFEKQMGSLSSRSGVNGTKHRGLTPGDFTPRWDRAKTSKNDKVSSVDIPINASYRYRAIRTTTEHGIPRAYEVEITQKLAVMKRASDASTQSLIVTLIPNKEFCAGNKGDISDIFLNSGDKGGFGGVAIYSDPETKIIIQVDEYSKGVKRKGVYLPKGNTPLAKKMELLKEILINISLSQSESQIISRSGSEDDWTTDDMFNWAEDWINSDTDGDTFHWEPSFGEPPWSPDYDPNKDYYYEGDHPYNPETDGPGWYYDENGNYIRAGEGDHLGNEYAIQKNDKIAKTDIPITMTSQVGNTCVFAIMGYINSIFGGNINYGTYVLGYMTTFSMNIEQGFSNGVSPGKLPEFINQYFNTSTFVSYQDAINNGHLVMTDIPTKNPTITHAIAIIGYQENGDLIYMDPLTGKLGDCSPSYIKESFVSTITGNK